MSEQVSVASSDRPLPKGVDTFWLNPFFVPLVIAVGLVIRLAVAVFLPVDQMSDSAWYVDRALEIAAGLGYQEGGVPTAYWPVGWPAILAVGYVLLGSMPVTIVLLNSVASVAIMYLTYWFGKEVAGNRMIGLVALLAYAVYPNHIAYIGNAATELVYTALAMGAFALLIHKSALMRWVFVSGLLFGLATLIKPQTLLFPFGAVIALALVKKSFTWLAAMKAGVVVYVAILTVVLPWTARNYAVFGEPILVSTNGGTGLIMGANDHMTGMHFDYEDTPVFTQFGIPVEQRVARQVELDRLQKERALEWISQNTGEYLSWIPRKVFYLWWKDTDGFWVFDFSYPSHGFLIKVFQLANQLFYLLVVVLMLIGGVIALRGMILRDEDRARLGLLYCMPVFVTLLAAVFTGQIRYHFPAMPYAFVAAAWVTVMLIGARKAAAKGNA